MSSTTIEEAFPWNHQVSRITGVDEEPHLPSLNDQPWHTLKVSVARNEWQRILQGNSSNPYVIVRDGRSLPPERHRNSGIVWTRVLVTRQHRACCEQL